MSVLLIIMTFLQPSTLLILFFRSALLIQSTILAAAGFRILLSKVFPGRFSRDEVLLGLVELIFILPYLLLFVYLFRPLLVLFF